VFFYECFIYVLFICVPFYLNWYFQESLIIKLLQSIKSFPVCSGKVKLIVSLRSPNRNLVWSQESPHDDSQECWPMLPAGQDSSSANLSTAPQLKIFLTGKRKSNSELATSHRAPRNTTTRSNEFFQAWLTGLPFWLAGSFCPTTSP